MARFCTNCGFPADESSRFCVNCGAPLIPVAIPVAEPLPEAIPTPTEQEPMPMEAEISVSENLPPVAEEPVPTAEPISVMPPISEPADPQVPAPIMATPQVNFEQPMPSPGSVYSGVPVYAPVEPAKPKKSKKKLIISLISAILAVVLIVVVAFSVMDGGGSGDSSDEPYVNPDNISRTVMIYIVGSDLESQSGAATLDIEEMLEAGINFEKNNILLCTGGASKWQNHTIDEDSTSIFLVEEDGLTEVDSSSSKNMGKSGTLSSFLEYCEENYPADRYSLILWNHGAGPMLGYGMDENYNDYLKISEMVDALADSPFGKKNKLELLGFDACLMGSIETAWAFKDYAKYFVASQEVEPGYGWDYNFLGDLNECSNGAEIGKCIIDSYFDYYDELFEENPRLEAELTLSCVNLSKIEGVEDGVNGLFSKANSDVVRGRISKISRCRNKTKAFGKFTTNTDYDLIDLAHITELLSDEYESEAAALERALGEYITYSRSNIKKANGVSIYHPYDNMKDFDEWIETFEDIGFAPDYAKYINNFVDEFEGSDSSNSYKTFSNTKGGAVTSGQKSDISIKLTDDQVDTFSNAQYYVFKRLSGDQTFSKEDEYLMIFSGQDVTLGSDGTLNASYAGKAVFGKYGDTGKYTDHPLSMYGIYDGTGEEKYYFPGMFWLFDGMNMDVENIRWLMKIKNGAPQLLNAYSMNAEAQDMFPDKYLMDSEDYDIYGFYDNAYKVSTGESGNTLLTPTGSIYGFEFSKEDGFSIELRPVDFGDGYYAVFVVEDIYGGRHFSDFIELGK